MNKQIRELAEQAREYATTRHPVSNIILSVNSDLFEQKFAELLIRECADVVRYYYIRGEPIMSCNITRHFGVEE
jgi:hypothetical protein